MSVEVARVEQDLGISLGVWGLGSTIVGRRADQPDDATRRRRLRRTLAINTALDVGYVAAGVALLRQSESIATSRRLRGRRSASELRGDGAAVVIQGGFLFLLDGISLARL